MLPRGFLAHSNTCETINLVEALNTHGAQESQAGCQHRDKLDLTNKDENQPAAKERRGLSQRLADILEIAEGFKMWDCRQKPRD